MRGGLPGSYRGQRGSRERDVQPVLALACEGATEAKYAQMLGRGSRFRVKPKVFPGKHGKGLVDEAVAYAAQLSVQHPDAEIVTGVLYDLETPGSRAVQAALDTAAYGRQRGVQVWISVPTIERWYMLHFSGFSPRRSAAVVGHALERLVQPLRIGGYKKPGSVRFYGELVLLTDQAVERCRMAHLPEHAFDCICGFVRFVQPVA